MNEGEFSGGQVQPTPNDQGNMPEQSADTANQAIISSADAGATESAKSLFSDSNSFDAPQGTISSTDDGANPGHLFGNRSRRGSSRRAPVEAQPFVPNPNAPDFFNDAMASMAPTPQPSSNKKGLKIAIIAAIALLVIGGGILIAFLASRGGGGGQGGVVTAEKAKEVLNKDDVLAATDLESEIKAIIVDDREDDNFFSKEYVEKIENGLAAYKKVAKGIESYEGIRVAEGEDGVDKSIKTIAEKMSNSIPVYEKIVSRYTALYGAYTSKDISKLDSIDDEEAKEAAKAYYNAYDGYEEFMEEKYIANKCDVEPDDMTKYPAICRTFYDELDGYEDRISEAASKTRVIVLGGIGSETLRYNFISEDLTALTAKLYELEGVNE